MSFSELFAAFNQNATAALLVLSLLGIAWLVRDYRRREEFAAEKLEAAHAAAAQKLEAANTAHLQTAMQVAPLAAKLVTCVEVLERIVDWRVGGAS